MKTKTTKYRQGRMDFTMEVVKSDAASGTLTVAMIPDPRRYSLVKHDGKPHYLDKHLKMLISAEEMAQGMEGLPIYYSPPSIENTLAYAIRRLGAVNSELNTGVHVSPTEAARPHVEFGANPQERNIAFISIDICGATAYRKHDEEGFDTAYAIFLQELGTLVGQFNGGILKTKGDGFIAHIDHPGFTTQCDNAVDLGLSLLVLVDKTVNPALASVNLRPFNVRIGADYGLARPRKLIVAATGFNDLDVSSDALNRAVKIEESCSVNQFRIGHALYELLHVRWLERAVHVPFDGQSVGIDGYKVYEIT